MFPRAAVAGSRRTLFAVAAALALSLSCERGPENILSPAARPSPGEPRHVVNTGEYAHFYVTAFPDDWTLFMGDHLPTSLATARQVVFVNTSAGDGNGALAYVETREAGSLAAIDSITGAAGAWSCGTALVLAHQLRRCEKGQVVSYYLRLPDGSPTGAGFAGRGSMALLQAGSIASLTAFDGSATYASWNELMATVREIIDHESGGQVAPYVEIHAPDFDRTINPQDHPDRYSTGELVRDGSTSRSWNLTWYVGSHTQVMAQNLAQAAHDLKQKAYYAYDKVVANAGYGYGRYDDNVIAWLWRTYDRTSVSVAPLPPAAPAPFSAVAYNSSRADLTWTSNSTIASEYDVERAPDVSGTPGPYALVEALGPLATSYSNTGLTRGTTYWYRVGARNVGGVSYSTALSVTTPLPPAAPTAFSAQATISTRVDLAWTANAPEATGYSVERAPGVSGAPGTFAVVGTAAASATTYADTTAVGGTSYWYRMRSVTAVDGSDYTPSVSVLTPATPPSPAAFTATATGAYTVGLSWHDTPGELTYTLERAPSVAGAAGTYVTIATLGANVTSYTDAGLTSQTTYWYRLRADIATESSAPVVASVTTDPLTPLPPYGLTVSVTSSSALTLNWVDNAYNETAYLIERAPDNNGTRGPFVQVATVGPNVTTYVNTGLLGATHYFYRIRGTNSAGNSPYTSIADAVTQPQAAFRTDFAINAHADDWQLFMGDQTIASASVATKMVFIYTTAGDADKGGAYWQARERAAQSAMDTVAGGTPDVAWQCFAQPMNGHMVMRCDKGRTVAWFMRLPDGGPSGDGYGRGSLAQLRDGITSPLTAVNGSASYSTWTDLATTVRAIVDAESGGAGSPWVEVHSADVDRTLNPGDHSDHTATADLVQAGSASRSWNLNWYVDYDINNRAINLTQAVHDAKWNVFLAYDRVMGSAGYGYDRYDTTYQNYAWRSYWRRSAAP